VVDRSHVGDRAAAEARGILRVVRALRAHQHRTAAGLFALFVLAYLWPALVGGKVLAPTTVLYLYVPFKAAAPGNLERLVNPELADVALSYYPWQVLARQLIRAGTFPAWNPYAFGGTQLWANPEVAWLSPFSLPLWIFSLQWGLGLSAALKLWTAGFGTYLLVRELKLGFWPGIVAGLGFTLCAFNVVWLGYGVFVSVAALLPWALWLCERILRRGSPAAGLALAGIVAAFQLGGHPGTQVHVAGAVVLYAGLRAATIRDPRRRERMARLALVAAALGVGTLVSAVVNVPAERAAAGTFGAAYRRNGAPGFPASSMPFHMIRTALFPDWWGRPSNLVSFQRPLVNYRERTFYSGAVVLLLATVALVSGGAWRRKAPFAALGAIGLAVALHVAGIWTAVVHLPLLDRVQDQRMALWFELAVCVLAAFGLQGVLDRPAQLRRAWGVAGAGVLVAVVAVVSLHPDGETLSHALHYVLHRSGVRALHALALASVAWWALFALAFAAILALVRWRPPARRLAGGLVALVVALDLLHFAHGYVPITSRARAVPPATPVVAFLQRHAAGARIDGLREALTNDFTTVYGLRDVRGWDAPQPTLRFFHLWQVMGPQAMPWGEAPVNEQSPKVTGLLGARYLVTPPGTRIASPLYRLAYRGHDARVYANAMAVPRAFAAANLRPVGSEHDEAEAIAEPSFDPRDEAVVRAEDVGGGTPQGGGGTVRVVRDRNAEVRLHATLPRRSLVVLDDTMADGWSVRVDGRPARAVRTDVVLRGVIAPAGTHTIVWSYRVPGLRTGTALSALGLLLALAWAAWLLLRRRAA
jgi:hypothetical protein